VEAPIGDSKGNQESEIVRMRIIRRRKAPKVALKTNTNVPMDIVVFTAKHKAVTNGGLATVERREQLTGDEEGLVGKGKSRRKKRNLTAQIETVSNNDRPSF
jgi:hypothetical protein